MAGLDENKALTPVFIVHLNGNRFSAEQEADVKEITVIDRIDVPSSCEISMSDALRKWTDDQNFSEAAPLKILLGYKDDVEEVLNAEITGIEPKFRMNADDTVVIHGHNQMQRLHHGKKSRTISNISYSDLIRQIATDAGMQCECDDLGSAQKFLAQREQTDYEYVMEIAKMHNCKVWAKDGKLFVKRIEEGAEENIVIEWGKTLIGFSPRLNSVGLISSVEVRGYDHARAASVSGGATIDDVRLKVGGDKLGGKIVKEKFSAFKTIVIDDGAVDQHTADTIAKSTISANSMDYITGIGRMQGNYKIKSGIIIELKSLGTRFSGKYFVKSVKHRFAAREGYITEFEVVRNAI